VERRLSGHGWERTVSAESAGGVRTDPERNPKVNPLAGDTVRGVELFRTESLVAVPYYNVLLVRDALFAVTGPSPRNWTVYGNILFEKLLVREDPGGTSPNKSSPYGHLKLVSLEEWRRLCVTAEPAVDRLSHPESAGGNE
jgi:hypothetical protein